MNWHLINKIILPILYLILLPILGIYLFGQIIDFCNFDLDKQIETYKYRVSGGMVIVVVGDELLDEMTLENSNSDKCIVWRGERYRLQKR